VNEPVSITVDAQVGIIELARPDKFNCLSSQAWELIDGARRRFEADTGVRAIVIRAQGKNFCTGADLDEVKSIGNDLDKALAFVARGHKALLALEASPLPVVAAVQGLCLAGGLELMLGADVVLAARSARIGDQHAQFGLIPGMGGTQRLPRVVGVRRALDIMFTARWLDAEEARQIGLVNTVVDDEQLWTLALEYAVKLTERSPRGLAEMKRLARDGLGLEPAQAMRLEIDAAARHIVGADTAEGLAAFAARRKPDFK
jgi:enoyl-CoA hydratase/carnithine racemase